PVLSPRGLIGRVLETGGNSARVLLLSDSESMVPVRRASDSVVAFAEGQGDGTVRLRLVNLGINPLKKGDVFVTSGAGGLYRPGIAVAVADEIIRDGAIARLLSNPAATDYVLIEPVWAQQARAIVAGASIAEAEKNPDAAAPPP
ncbi:MAG TPA: rod shape-determining protein MreC, partial [Croceibacterium sp.]|nr:rod shape-determining protein MreC [Croceibacterium sp.]